MNFSATPHAAEACERRASQKRTPFSGRSNVQSRPPLAIHSQSIVWEDKTIELQLTERPSGFALSLPLSGIDPRQVYIQASSNSLLIEFRAKQTIPHTLFEGEFKESIDKRMSVEFTLPFEIAQGATAVVVYGGLLEITARKAPRMEQAFWSEFFPFPMRSGASH